MSGNYQGQADSSSTSPFNSDVFLIERVLNNRNIATLVQVVKAPYDTSGNAIPAGSAVKQGRIDILPLVNQLDGKNQPMKHTTVYGVPYFRFQGGANAVLCDPSVGDVGLYVVADRDISSVKATGQQSNPGSKRRSDLSDGTFVGLCLGGVPKQFIRIYRNGDYYSGYE